MASSPIIILTHAVVRLNMGRPVFFRQTRPGLHGAPFEIIKFRTMLREVPTSGRGLGSSDADRMTPLGKKLRAVSFDELPELWNVIRGDMSLVGPRPLLMEYLPKYSSQQARRHEVRPGLTGWAQINGRNLLSWQEKFNHDVWYVDNVSFGLDLRILIQTVRIVIRGTGVSAQGEATTTPFTG